MTRKMNLLTIIRRIEHSARESKTTTKREYIENMRQSALEINEYVEHRIASCRKLLNLLKISPIEFLTNNNNYVKPLDLVNKIKFLNHLFIITKILRIIRLEKLANKINLKIELKLSKLNEVILDAEKKFNIEKKAHNDKVEKLEKKFLNGDKATILEIFKLSAQQSIVEKVIQELLEDRQFDNPEDYVDVYFDKDSKTLAINAILPSQDCLPREVEYKYISTSDKITSKTMKEKDFNRLYDSMLSQIVLLYGKLTFTIIPENVACCVVVNGYAKGIDTSTGKELTNCIISVSISREKFKEIDFEHVDPVECLKYFKARVASEFINISPVNPILQFDKNDNRFISAESVIDNFDNSTNLATMDWEKFEYLVRDLFSKMFSEQGGEVKITQASRDKGVDAIVFDPDPIRGGKFVIQCKRYNNVVGVSDVRDLWGTVMHEGASKGIIVTTSHFGMDSIEWAKDKPITLINGKNLLSLFQKYGYDFKIQLRKNNKKE